MPIVTSATTTAGDIIRLALRDAGVVGVGQTPLNEDTDDSLSRLNMMIGQWAQKRWLVYHLKDIIYQSTGALSYTIGTGGQFNTPRPDRIESAFARQNSATTLPIDYPIDMITSREEYNRIALKSLASFPQFLFYDSDFPLGNLFWYPVPNNAFELHVSVKDQLGQFPNLTTQIVLPSAYFDAIYYNLQVRLRDAYDMPPKESTTNLAQQALQTIRIDNAQIPTLTLPPALNRGQGRYNILSDQVY